MYYQCLNFISNHWFCSQIYEFLVYCTQHSDHNVLTATLETLQQLLKTPPVPLLKLLLSPSGIPSKTIFPSQVVDHGKGEEEEEEDASGEMKSYSCGEQM